MKKTMDHEMLNAMLDVKEAVIFWMALAQIPLPPGCQLWSVEALGDLLPFSRACHFAVALDVCFLPCWFFGV